jgi:hypothetical protein
MWPQVSIIVLMFASLMMNAHLHGKPRDQKYNVWYALVIAGIWVFLLWAGGFWDSLFAQ